MLRLLPCLVAVFHGTGALANPACAVCTVAIGATLSVSRQLGICDNSVAIWMGAFLVLLGYWTIKWFDKKNWHFRGRDTLLILLSFSMIFGLYIRHLTYTPCLWIFDAFLLWAMVGGLVYILSQRLYQWTKRKNGGRAHFPFEKVVIAICMLMLTSIVASKISI